MRVVSEAAGGGFKGRQVDLVAPALLVSIVVVQSAWIAALGAGLWWVVKALT
jgi:hypothetical protein